MSRLKRALKIRRKNNSTDCWQIIIRETVAKSATVAAAAWWNWYHHHTIKPQISSTIGAAIYYLMTKEWSRYRAHWAAHTRKRCRSFSRGEKWSFMREIRSQLSHFSSANLETILMLQRIFNLTIKIDPTLLSILIDKVANTIWIMTVQLFI